MKLTFSQLETHLVKKLSPIYIVSGDELLLKQEAVHLIRKAAKQAGFTERTRFTPDAGFDWDTLYTLLYSTSLLAEKRLLELHFRHATPTKNAANILQEYAKRPVSHLLLLIDIGKVDDKVAKSAWYASLQKTGIAITLWPIPREQLPQWIIERAKKYKLSFSQDAANCLADQVEGNLVAALQAIEKIYLLRVQAPIDRDLIQSVLTDESRFTLFDFIEQLIRGERSSTLHILDHLKADGTEPVLILWGITRELRLLAECAEQLKQGASYDNVFQKYRIFSRRQTAVRHFLTRFSAKDCWHFLSHAAGLDALIKGAMPGDAWSSLQLFCLKFAL